MWETREPFEQLAHASDPPPPKGTAVQKVKVHPECLLQELQARNQERDQISARYKLLNPQPSTLNPNP
jgi:hypothetical protein